MRQWTQRCGRDEPPSVPSLSRHRRFILVRGRSYAGLQPWRLRCVLRDGFRSTVVEEGRGPGGRHRTSDSIDASQTHRRRRRTSHDDLASIAARSYGNYPTRWKKTYFAVIESKNSHTIAWRTGAMLSRMVPLTMMLWRRRRHGEHRAPARSEMRSHEPLSSSTGRSCQRYQGSTHVDWFGLLGKYLAFIY